MPNIVFTAAEQNLISQILRELDPARHELTASWKGLLDGDDWSFVEDYVRAKIRTVLETGLTFRSMADLARSRALSDESAIRRNFVHELWSHNFSFHSEIEEAFMELAGGSTDSPLYISVEALINLAEDRVFGTLEDAYELLIEGSSS